MKTKTIQTILFLTTFASIGSAQARDLLPASGDYTYQCKDQYSSEGDGFVLELTGLQASLTPDQGSKVTGKQDATYNPRKNTQYVRYVFNDSNGDPVDVGGGGPFIVSEDLLKGAPSGLAQTQGGNEREVPSTYLCTRAAGNDLTEEQRKTITKLITSDIETAFDDDYLQVKSANVRYSNATQKLTIEAQYSIHRGASGAASCVIADVPSAASVVKTAPNGSQYIDDSIEDQLIDCMNDELPTKE